MMGDQRSEAVILEEVDLARLTELAANETRGLYAVIDGTGQPDVPRQAQQREGTAVSLYRGSAAREYWAVAPYLFQVDPSLLNWISETLWDEPWGVFMSADIELEELRKHLRRFLLVEDPAGNEMYFCYYDPRVLISLLRSASRDEASEFFGPIEAFYAMGEDQGLVLLRWNSECPAGASWSAGSHHARRRLRPEMIDSMMAHRRSDFEQRLLERLCEVLPRHGIPATNAQTAEQVRLGCQQAQRYGLTRENDVARYVELICTRVGGFVEDRPDVVEIQNHLYDRRHSAERRLDQLQNWLYSRDGVSCLSKRLRGLPLALRRTAQEPSTNMR